MVLIIDLDVSLVKEANGTMESVPHLGIISRTYLNSVLLLNIAVDLLLCRHFELLRFSSFIEYKFLSVDFFKNVNSLLLRHSLLLQLRFQVDFLGGIIINGTFGANLLSNR